MMYFVISPTKTMQIDLRNGEKINFGKEIVDYLQTLSIQDIEKIMKVNKQIATENYHRYQTMNHYTTAIYGYHGLQFKQLGLTNYTESQLQYMQKHIRILSAMYGVVKPFDVIACYRLDLTMKLPFNLYQYWEEKIAHTFQNHVIIDLTSDEYGKMIPNYVPKISIQFMVKKNGKLKRMATISKIARGKFVDLCILNQIREIDQLKSIVVEQFVYSEVLSTDTKFVFVKEESN